MIVLRTHETEVEKLNIGDVVKIEVDSRDYTMTAIAEKDENMLCIFDEIIELYPMNKNGGTEGGYENSDLRKRLQELEKTIPEEIRQYMRPAYKGDLLTIPTRDGLKDHIYFNDGKNYVASYEGNTEWWWLQDVVSASAFAGAGTAGAAGYYASHTSIGVRPFALINPSKQSPRKVATTREDVYNACMENSKDGSYKACIPQEGIDAIIDYAVEELLEKLIYKTKRCVKYEEGEDD